MFVIQRGRPHGYLGYDQSGKPKWTHDILEATRIDTHHDAKSVLRKLGSTLLTIQKVGLHGYYKCYRGFFIQIYKEGHRDWRVRYTSDGSGLRSYIVGKRHAESPKSALRYGRELVNQTLALVNSYA